MKHTAIYQEPDAVIGIERLENAEVVGDMVDADRRHGEEPDDGDRAEKDRHGPSSARLDRKQHDQDDDRNRHDILMECRRDDLETFDRRQDRQRRRDHRIAEKQRGAENADQQQDAAALFRNGLDHQRQERQRAAFAVIVRLQQKNDVFERDDDRQCPEEQRDQADNCETLDVLIMGDRTQGFAKGIKRARADIAVDDSDRADRERQELSRRHRAMVAAGLHWLV
jgi:hypothetical protein